VALWLVSLGHIHPYRSGPAGLIGQLPWVWWAGLAAVVLGLVVAAVQPNPSWTLGSGVVALAVVLHATAPAAESVPRFWVAYVHAGFADYIGRTGRTLPDLDARMSWPGLFAAAGMAARAMGVPTTWFIRWAPLVFNLAYLLPLRALASASLRTERARWAALALFVAGDWVGQDYFSPQAIGLFFYLAVLAVVVRWFPEIRTSWFQSSLRRGWDRWWSSPSEGSWVLDSLGRLPAPNPTEAPALAAGRGTRVALVGALLLISGGLVVTHQLTPVGLCVALAFLTFVGRTQLRNLWLIVLVMIIAWLSWIAQPYWAGHLSQIFGGFGQFGSNVGSSLGSHLDTKVPLAHRLVLDARILDPGIVGAAVVVAVAVSWLRGRTDWTMAALCVAPVSLAAGQSYGGEVILRIFLFSLPAACVLIAGTLELPDRQSRNARDGIPTTGLAGPRPSRVAMAGVAAVGILLVGLFPLTRWGNESFEAIAPEDMAVAQWVVDNVPTGSTLLVPDTDTPVYFERIADLRIVDLTPYISEPPSAFLASILDFGPRSWIVISRSETEAGVVEIGYASDWMAHLEQILLSSGRFVVRFETMPESWDGPASPPGSPTGLVLQEEPARTPR
jgi:hypothetical protein